MNAIITATLLLITVLPATPAKGHPQDVLPRSNGCRIETVNLVTGRRSQGQWYPKEKADSLRAEIKAKNIAQPEVNHILVCI